MASAASNDARIRWSELLDTARTEPVHITRRGRDVAVLVSQDFFERAIQALEDAADLAAVSAARDDNEPTVTHEELMRELGLAP
ncbi:MAG: type II toxin-antitoxin system prevent-host-death family antitoxin [Salinibacterium sp.]|nr:MAG: type II toxin-antitoxin system prevent-host-death family antitoxin [Salinibacterium sp.]